MKNRKIDNSYSVYPSSSLSYKVLVVCHGFGGEKIEYSQYEILFNRLHKEYTIITFGFSGYSENKLLTNSINEWVDELDILINSGNAASCEISLLGISLGAWVTSLYCSKHPRIKYNICIGGVFSLHMSMKSGNGIAYQFCEDQPILNDIMVSKDFIHSLIINQPICFFRETCYDAETIILVGNKDNSFRKADAYLAHKLLSESYKSNYYRVIEDGNHFINNDYSQIILAKIIEEFLINQ